MRWRPLSMRGDPERVAEYDVLHDGIPRWMAAGATRWVMETLSERYNADLLPVLTTVEQLLRLPLDWTRGEDSALSTLINEVGDNRPRALDVVDACLLIKASGPGSWKERESLEAILSIAGSAWTVGTDPDGRSCLHRRVDETVESAAKDEMNELGNAAQHLRVAWHDVYGRSPNASHAYREAVRAVEAAAKPVITPNDRLTTLGKMLHALREKPAKWTCDLGTVESLTAIMGELWTAQLDRHGTNDESIPLSVTPAQAEAAVHLALMLVHWFRNGHVKLA